MRAAEHPAKSNPDPRQPKKLMSTAYVKENRRIQRIALPLPVRVEVKIDANVSWNEITRLQDVSAFGAGFMLKRPTKRGRLIMLTIPILGSLEYSILPSRNTRSGELSVAASTQARILRIRNTPAVLLSSAKLRRTTILPIRPAYTTLHIVRTKDSGISAKWILMRTTATCRKICENRPASRSRNRSS
ncbi:MAG: hypothetical protein UZ17_ACD001001282 [Acidobacteria bacterium OLB17]|nr:MAG: hypothetical protein UZ17_ACD001001282 [Acidobacteria bacterium OLB17]